ncbi:MAG TPA: proline dehydrogenase family protein [Vicinamibacterales bacterium]|nr:proline dehydrogenase family protein [Vicinamibacterales bacterium]
MLDVASKAFFQALSHSQNLKRLASRYGMRGRRSFARRFIAGETLEDAIAAVRQLEAQGLRHTLDHLGESVPTLEGSERCTREYLGLIEDVARAGVERNISLKLTQLGLDVDRATCTENLQRILAAADRHEFFVRIDMESSAYTESTLSIFETVWRLGSRRVGVVLQSCLYRTDADVERMNAIGARVRLVKGAYREPKSAAFQRKADVDAAYLEQAKRLLAEGTYPAIATHDETIIAEVKQFAAAQAIGPDRYEFQMLYGIRRDLQSSLVAEGYRVRVYVPFGREWFPYFMRRLGERPANVGFVLRSLLSEKQ